MTSHTPAVLITLVSQPVMPKKFGVKVMCVKRGMMDVWFGTIEDEKAIMVHRFMATIEVEECRDVLAGVVVYNLERLLVTFKRAGWMAESHHSG
jgi:hypothetical protein